MSDTDIAWAAGIFDGEGCVTSTGTGRQAIVTQSSDSSIPEVLVRFQSAVGLGKINGPYFRARRKPHWRWTCGKPADLDRLFAALWPYLSGPKKDQARRHNIHPQKEQ